jgi:HEAT repeat protein
MVAFLILVTPVVADTREEQISRHIKDLDAKDTKTRTGAAEEIGKIAAIKATYGKPAVEKMLKTLKDKEAPVRAAAAEAIGKMDEPKKVVPALLELLKTEKNESVKIGAVTGLGLVGEPAKEAVKVIREMGQQARKDKNNRLAQACRQAVENITGARKK